jgi:glycosyltransferase involved in cell wall biosynthesis
LVGGRGLPRALDSALAGVRALADWAIPAEVLVVGDRSDHGEMVMLQQLEAIYYGQGLRLFLREDRSDAGAAFTLVLRRATYRYVVCLDGSDELSPDALPLFYRAMCDTSAALVYGNLIVHRPDGVIVFNDDDVLRSLWPEPYLIDTCALWDRLQLGHAGGRGNDQAISEAAEQIRRLVFVPVVFGHHHHDLRGPENPPHSPRISDQADQREKNESKSQFLRYHPDLGYL